ncbi:LuxR C-terminal-related transcriptional regulator [Pseudofrankia asymbiotica]|uniref:HTH luxR-type domain-containing protein n=1 Tax=Pseudofrankia asymbiotica TaxID=1834516 RepID=A0A1V2I1E2_9ACTN|nr:LuxR C-terminal-related transcriptional regulator [Pseudofrankia asymbiotica]ONH23620.1 hypothetical protein BL253_32515 [Pseudofrankia asymbiotica]
MRSDIPEDSLLGSFLATLSARLREETSADLTMAGRVDPRTRILTIRSVDGTQPAGLIGRIVEPGRGAGGRAVMLGRHILADPERLDRAVCVKGIRSLLAVPVRCHGRVEIVVYVGSRSEYFIDAAMTAHVLWLTHLAEKYLAEAAGPHGVDGPWRRMAYALHQVESQLERIRRRTSDPVIQNEIATIRRLVLLSMAEEQSRVAETSVTLSPRELDLLGLVAEGLSNAEAAEQMLVTRETVKSYLRSIRGKLGVNNRTAAVSVARRLGMLR